METRGGLGRAARKLVNGDATQVFVVAPAPFARAGLRSMFEDAEMGDGVQVVGEAGSLVEAGPVLSEADVVVVAAAGDEFVEETARTVAELVAEEGTQAILLLSEDDRSLPALRSLAPRGWGVVSPDALPEEVWAAVAAVARGLVVLPRALTERLLRGPAVFGGAVEELVEPLTAREREVLGLLGQGLSNKMIARDLHISEHTVKFHVSSIYTKLGASSRAEAVSLGARHGLISL
ncbi:MAG TPA: response regulator transcription factor, partial [Rubrobacteraceae bacterium]|nr:response regulator transcription factor [Rubrobacteraceae bacterium]